MNGFIQQFTYFGVFLSLAAYLLGMAINKRWKSPLTNPMIIALAAVILVLVWGKIDYVVYYDTAKYLSYLLTPATVCLAVPLYRQLQLLRRNLKAILLGICSGVVTSAVTILVLSRLFQLDHATYVTLLPKSITTAIGMGISEELGGAVTITVACIIITGILGNCAAQTLCRLFRIQDPIAKGVAVGTSAHAFGTVKALEMGEVEGAMSSLSIAVAGLLTVVSSLLFAPLL